MNYNVITSVWQHFRKQSGFGTAVHSVGKCVVLAAGRPTPRPGESMQRGEGVALVLAGPAIAAWNAGGQQWKSWGSRIVRATLSARERPREKLQSTIDQLPSSERYVILGDFNARVGSRKAKDDHWQRVRGPFGLGEENDAGRDLLNFLLLNESTICNSWFMNSAIHKRTWQHPKSKMWHCIDYAIMKQSDRRSCMGAEVKCGAECHTDHQLLLERHVGKGGKVTSKRYAVSNLSGTKDGAETKQLFAETATECVSGSWRQDSTVEYKWGNVKEALTTAADSVLGYENHRNPDWFHDSSETLEPLFVHRNQLYSKWLSSKQDCDKVQFLQARSRARKAVRAAKNSWFQRKAEEVQSVRFGGKKVWQCIRDVQRAHRGLVPTRSTVVRNNDGTLCATPEAQHKCWRQHFSSILNICSHFSLTELGKVKQRPVEMDMADPPSMEELMQAVKKIKAGKAGGKSGILPEMLKASCCKARFRHILLDLVQSAWRERRVPQDWSDAVLIRVPKKDLTICDNWRRIALLDVVGKVVAKIVQERMQKLAEDVLPESQCGFRRGRGCADMAYRVRNVKN